MVYNLGETNSIANQFLYELRNVEVQHDPMRFRRNMERLGEIMAYEISRRLTYAEEVARSPLGKFRTELIEEQPVLITVLRAGIPYYQGFIRFFDKTESGFIGAYRREGEAEVEIQLDYLATPNLFNRTVILIDPMLATGKSFVKSINVIGNNGKPRHIHVASLVSTPEGISYIRENIAIPLTIWTFAIDRELNSNFYIVPGLGDAGDLAFGEKL